jgi:hypothetical protein
MRKPTGVTGFVGSQPVTLAILAGCAFSLYLWYYNSDAAVLGLASLWVAAWAMNANAKVAEYKAWKRAWDAMGPDVPQAPRKDHPALKACVFVLIVLGVGYALHSNPDEPGYRIAFYWLVGGSAALLFACLVRFTRRAGGSANGHHLAAGSAVEVCVGRPLMSVPNLKGAFDALPAHCWRVLGVPGA